MDTIAPRPRAEVILVVDDNLQNRLLAESQLVPAGYAVRLAEDGREAIRSFQEAPPDLVLLDVMMPGMDGFQTCAELRKLPGGIDTPIVFVTAVHDPVALDAAAEAGGDDYLPKPINREELLIRIRSLLRIKRMSHELQRGYDALARSERQKADLSQFLIHDLKNPLSAILANAQYALSIDAVDGATRDALGDIVTSVDSMNRMLMNLLDIGRSDDGELQLHPSPCQLDALITDACNALRTRAAERGMQLRVSGATAVQIVADRHLLRRVIDNLLDNALKYAPARSSVEVELEARSADQVLLSIRDQGDGVPDALKRRIFDRFVQLDAHAASHGRVSRGLGLAFCKLAVEAHGGTIWIEDALPQGNVFRVQLSAPELDDEVEARRSVPA